MAEPDLLADLLALLDDSDLNPTFSANCRSGLISRDLCQCWRCRGVEPNQGNPKWKDAARWLSIGFMRSVKADPTERSPESRPSASSEEAAPAGGRSSPS